MQNGAMTNYPQGFAGGLSVRGLPLLQSYPGSVYWVSNAPLPPGTTGVIRGSDNNPGTFQKPFRTIAGALAQCGQNAGDIVMVKPGHRETISNATTIALNVANCAIIGLGAGNSRPTFVLDTATTANLPLRAQSMTIQNLVFIANFADIASFITAITANATTSTIGTINSVPTFTAVAIGAGTFYPGMGLSGTGVLPGTVILRQLTGTTGGVGTYEVSLEQTVTSTTITGTTTDFSIDSCEFRDTTNILNALTVFTASGTANCCDGFSFTNNKVKSLGTTAATTAIKTTVGQDRWTINGNRGASAVLNDTAAVLAAGAAQLTNLFIVGNVWTRPNTSSTGGSFVSGTGNAWTGVATYNVFTQADATAGIWISTGHGTGFGYAHNFSNITFAADTSAITNPAAA